MAKYSPSHVLDTVDSIQKMLSEIPPVYKSSAPPDYRKLRQENWFKETWYCQFVTCVIFPYVFTFDNYSKYHLSDCLSYEASMYSPSSFSHPENL